MGRRLNTINRSSLHMALQRRLNPRSVVNEQLWTINDYRKEEVGVLRNERERLRHVQAWPGWWWKTTAQEMRKAAGTA